MFPTLSLMQLEFNYLSLSCELLISHKFHWKRFFSNACTGIDGKIGSNYCSLSTWFYTIFQWYKLQRGDGEHN